MEGLFRALRVEEVAPGKFDQRIESQEIDALPAHELLIEVEYSSLNYKDALSAFGQPGVTREYPHTPGIDAAGRVLEDASGTFQPGQQVLVTGYDLGMNTAGGLAERIRVPASWAVACPESLGARDAMALGTAGLTAGLCVQKLLAAGASPDGGTAVVTGATGGVGSIAVALLAKLGFRVAAVTGKLESAEFLTTLGAEKIIDRDMLAEYSPRALVKPQWQWGVDSVGGETLFNLIKATGYGGAVAACGLAGGAQFNASVYPFILRGVSLLGIDSVEQPLSAKAAVWEKLAGEWNIGEKLARITEELSLAQAPEFLARLHRGHGIGRYIVNLNK